ncbi:long-chain fatty acid--CoA ligase [Salimicrobium jeotgali]|uniref:Long-chain-fatty-acid--CoA ligase n=1 Tax=Salimicrobium jeotgali TaxID=1230341 RepID=K2FL39_9BACI|nr:fatty acid--CoA ligase family protein [Salimicrobium jeotgali]AKG04993.1 long-chain fatty acid--CoA ligase [Salimicrobium jeotgali]EKE31676.1 long-chain-fatty-acid--CoA ligase [Salimicrobium jeotgali]MBM7696498.1 long-chain acyl-CoA synthetase [Salimicrobium jeotgali]
MNVSERLSLTAREMPGKDAYIFQGERTDYRTFDAKVTKFASALEDAGFEKGDHVALISGNSPVFMIGLYGALRAGLSVIPINPTYTSKEMKYILKNGDVKGVITLDVLVSQLDVVDDELDVTHYFVADTGADIDLEAFTISPKMKSFTKAVEQGSASFTPPSLDDDDLAVILYTSGTTGKPKGAMLTHKNIYSNAKDVATYLEISEEDRVIATLPMFHVFCLTVALNAPIVNGGTIIVIPQFSPGEVFKAAKEYEATVFAGVPTMYNYLLQTGDGQESTFENMRINVSGGSSLPVSLLEAFEKKFNVRVSEGYGLSEASPVTAFNPLDRPRRAGSIGQNITNVENKVVDELGQEVPAGETGELVVKGPNVMKGYYKMPEETAVTIKDGWLFTGDMAREDEEGYFYIVDRKKDLIIVGGYNVYPREVEEVLYQHPEITEAAVVGEPHPEMGEAVIAFVVSDNPSLNEEAVIEYCKKELAKYKLPQRVEFMEELPKNTTGKILRKNLREHLQQS